MYENPYNVLRVRQRRPYRQIERRYVVQYVNHRFPDAVLRLFNVRLGVPKPIAKGIVGPEWYAEAKLWAPMADAVVVTRDTIWVVEAKIRYPRHAIGQLLDYARRVYQTPTLMPYIAGRRVQPLLVVPLSDDELRRTCEMYGIVVDVFTPCWVIDYMVEVGMIPERVAYVIKREGRCIHL